jgi:S1-C subfamily serine protease
MKSLTTLIFVGVLIGCATTAIRDIGSDFEPLPLGKDGSVPITLSRVVIRVPAGTQIGAHHDGLLQVPQFNYNWQSNITIGSDEYVVIGNEELKNNGYTVLGMEVNTLLFGEDPSAKARYMIGATITEVKYNTYAPLAGNFSETRLEVEWQLFDSLQKEILFKSKTRGYGKQPGVSSGASFVAFRKALTNLMANKDFVKLVSKKDENNTVLSLPKETENVLEGVVTIQVGSSIASGVIISDDGYILTAAHVVSDVQEVVVNLKSGLTLDAAVVRNDNPQDIALLKIPGKGHQCLPLALNQIPAIGSDIFAIGTPFSKELSLSISKGIVSGHRIWNDFPYIQTDASLSPGNSGGPLVNRNGEVVGIVSWKILAPGFEGLSFGIPLQAIEQRLGIAWKF